MSSDVGSPDRRRSRRVAVEDAMECRLEIRTRVRLLDISLSGALLASDARLPIGTKGQLRTALASTPFAPEVHVQRHADGHQVNGRGEQSGVGTVFRAMDERSRRSLEDLLRKASS